MAENSYCLLMHLSILLSGSGLGIVAPIVLWAVNKDESPVIDQHGKNIFNFLISMLIYAVASIPLFFIGVGILTFIAVAIAMIVCPIIAGIKANDGIYWPYPLCIRFFK
jgi:uncharacterized Tic20 family protein